MARILMDHEYEEKDIERIQKQPGEKFSITEFNNNPEIKAKMGRVFRYLNANTFTGAGLLGIKETAKEYLGNPAETLRDEMLSVSTLAARRAAINNAPESIKKDYADLLDTFENQTEIKGFKEGLGAVKDYTIDLLTSPESYVGGGFTVGKTALQTAAKSSAVGATWAGADNYIRQSKDVEIDRLDEISAPEVLASTAAGGTLGYGIGGSTHKLGQFFTRRSDQQLLNKIESKKLEEKTTKSEVVPIQDDIDVPVEKIDEATDDIIKLRDSYLEATRELARRDRLFGTRRSADFDPQKVEEPLIFGDIDPNEVTESVKKLNKEIGGGGSKTDQELQDIINGTLTKLEGMSEGRIKSELAYNISRYANRFGSNLFFKPSSAIDPFTKNSSLARVLQKMFRYDSQRDLFGARKFDDQDFGEVFKSILGENYVTFKKSLHPIQNSTSGKLTEDINSALIELLRDPKLVSGSDTLESSRVSIRNLLDKIGDDLLNTGVIRNKVEENYVPRSWNRKKIEKNRADFINRLVKSGEAKDLDEARAITESMLDKRNQLDQGGGGGGASFFYTRPFKKLKDNDFADYLDSDVNAVMINYIAQSAKALAKRKVFNVNNLEEFTSFYIDGIDTQMRKAGKQLTLRDKKTLQKVYNYATGENLDRFEGIPGLALDLYGTVNRLAYLPLATISSITEVAINIAKAGPTTALKGFAGALNDARGTIQDRSLEVLKKQGLTEREAWRELQEFGMDLDPVLVDTVERLSGSLIRNSKLQKVNNTFFRFTLLDQWTKFVQLTSYKTGKQLIIKNLKAINEASPVRPRDSLGRFFKPDKAAYFPGDSKRIKNMKDQLNELGVDIEEGIKWIRGGESLDNPFYKNIKSGAARYTNEVILMPSAESGLKPFFTGDPKTSILFQFLGYPIAFTNTVLKNAAKDIIRNPTQNAPKALAAGLIMTEMARWTNWARSRGKSEENKSPLEIYSAAIRRWGGNGIVADMMGKAREATKVYQDPIAGVASGLGPVGNDLYKIAKRGDLVRIMGEKVPGYGALGFISPEAKSAYTEYLRDKSRDFKKATVRALGAEDTVEPIPIRSGRAEGGLATTGSTVENVPNVAEEPQERINPYTGEPYDVTAGSFNQDLIDRNDRSDPLRRLGFFNGGKADPSMFRSDGSKKSSTGFLGPIKNNVTGGIMTEVSVDLEIEGQRVQVPTLVPTLTNKEIEILSNMKLEGNAKNIPRSIIDKAAAHAKERIAQNKNPFYVDGEEQRLNKAEGGNVVKDSFNYVVDRIQSLEPAIAKAIGFKEKDLQFAIDSDKKYDLKSKLRGEGDSIRHVTLGAAAYYSDNPKLAKKAIDFRDRFSSDDRRGIRKDLKNNQIGFDLAKESASMEEVLEKALVLAKEGKLGKFK